MEVTITQTKPTLESHSTLLSFTLALFCVIMWMLVSISDADGSRSTSTSQLSGLKQLSLSPMLRAHGYITLGKTHIYSWIMYVDSRIMHAVLLK